METKLKDQIVAAAKQYITSKGLSQAAFARLCDISPGRHRRKGLIYLIMLWIE